jgi:hypothetical protein
MTHASLTGYSPEFRSSLRQQRYHSPDVDEVVAEKVAVTGNYALAIVRHVAKLGMVSISGR